MKTRTLLILAVTCGLAILIAGGVQLLRLANQDKPGAALKLEATAQLGDAVVTVHTFVVTADAILVTVTLSGVDDPDGVNGFTLIAPDAAISADPAAAVAETTDPPICAGFTIEPVDCILRFPATDLKGSDRMLLFQRAAEQVRWRLA